MNQECDRIQADAVFRDDGGPAASTLKLSRRPKAADVSPPRREGISQCGLVGARRMRHRRDRRRPIGNSSQPLGQAVDVEEVIAPRIAGDTREIPGKGKTLAVLK